MNSDQVSRGRTESEPLYILLKILGGMKELFLITALLAVAILAAGCTSAPGSPHDQEAYPTNATPAPATIAEHRNPSPPEEEDGPLPLGEIVTFRDAREENELSLKVASFIDRGRYEPAGEPLKFTAPRGWRYLFVHVVVTHRGHRGDGYRTTVYAPPIQQFSLVDNGRTYHPVFIQADYLLNIGEVYHGDELVDRNGKSEGYIVYEVPESTVDSGAVVVADIVGLKDTRGRDCYNLKYYDKNPAWRLS